MIAAAAVFSAAPLAVDMGSYLPWFARGYSVTEWIALQLDMFRIQGPGFKGLPENLAELSGAGRWFVSWVGSGSADALMRRSDKMSLLINDPVVWVLFVPAALLLAWAALRRNRVEWLVIAAIFLGGYTFFVVSPRPIVLYSAMAIVPFGFIALGFAIAYLFRQRGWWVLGALAAWSLYLYPVVARGLSPVAVYSWILQAVLR
jgi:hypothetical protein